MTARIFLKDYFEAEGHEVVEATDGLEFVKLIEDGEKYDIVFCDQTMSHMNGSVAAKKVRDFEANSNVKPTPIILITAYDSLESESDANCFDRIFRKPVDISKVEKALNAFVYSDAPVSRKKSIATDTQIIDLEDLRSRCAGKEKTMLRVLDAFKETSVAQLNKLEDTAVLSNIEQLKKTIHTIKGLLRDAGANNGAEIVSEIEEKIATNKAIEDADVKAIRELIQKTCASADNIKSRI